MNLTKTLWGISKTEPGKKNNGKEIWLYRITNQSGAYVELSSVGANIVSIVVPDKDGHLTDVVLGYPEANSYFYDGPCFGKIPGRYANRIALGKFSLDGKAYTLPVNNGPNHLHGGPEGFQNQVWESRIDGEAVEFLYSAEDGEMGYPGAVDVVARYEWSEDNCLTLTLSGKSDAPTVLNLTNHVYFNLKGEGKGNIFDHELTLNASEWLPTSDSLIPLGESVPVAGTPMDFVTPKLIGKDAKADFDALRFGKGYDNCWVIDGAQPGQLQDAAELYAPESGIAVKVTTTQPGVQIYTGNWLSGCPVGKNGHRYEDYDGVAIECQNFPDAPNKPEYPSPVLRPDETYQQAIIFAFYTK
ncbi:MAG: galactose mutarotase [Bacteroidales bacterium]|nr:galactose mutarotase [Bacteroidales bacterium]